MTSPLVGTRIDNYRVLEAVGEGGMGAVYRAFDVMLERDVALKFLRPELASDPDVVERFRHEAVVLARFQHPNIASVFGLHRHGDQFFMAMEYVPGNTLEKILAAGPLLPAQAIGVTLMVLDALEYAHRRGVVHRDIKASNLMLTLDGVVKVMDFGIARVLGGDRRTRAGLVVGTLSYMSPEQIQGLDVDARSDIYSTGIAVYEMLSGRPPFAADTEWALMQAQVKEPPPPFPADLQIPAGLEAIVMKALAKSPQDRYDSATAFRAALVAASPAGAPQPTGSDATRDIALPLSVAQPDDMTAIQTRAKSGSVQPRTPSGLGQQATGPVPPPRRPTAPPREASSNDETRLTAPVASTSAPTVTIATGAYPPPLPAEASMPAPAPSTGSVATSPAPPASPPAAGPALAPRAPATPAKASGPGIGKVPLAAVAVIVVLVVAGAAWMLLRPGPGADEVTPAEPAMEGTAPDATLSAESPTLPPPPSGQPASPVAPPSAVVAPPAPTAKPQPEKRAARDAAKAAPPPESAPVAAPPVPEPTPAAPAAPPAPALPPARFGNVRLVDGEGERAKERVVILVLEAGRVVLLAPDGRTEVQALPYASITAAEYSTSRARVLVVRSTRHFLKLDSGGTPMLLRIDGDDRRRLLDAFTARSGVAIAGRDADSEEPR